MNAIKKHFWLDSAVCAVLALAFTSAPYYLQEGTCAITWAYIFTSLACWAVFLGLDLLGHRAVETLADLAPGTGSQWKCSLMEHRGGVFLCAGILFVFWLPWLIALFPGTCINDTWGELSQFIRFTQNGFLHYGVLSDHHPVFDTMVMGCIIVPLASLTGKWQLSIFIYVLLQAAATAIAFSCMVRYTYRRLMVPVNAALGALAFLALVPVFPMCVQTVSKDALFSWIYVFYSLLYAELVRTSGESIRSKRFLFWFIIVSVLCCLTKKVGVYVIILSLIGLALFQKLGRRRVMAVVLCCVLVMFGAMPLVRTRLGIERGGRQEMLSIPFQMTARYVKEHPDDITEEEYEVIDSVLGMADLAERYVPTAADPVKGYGERGTTEDYIRYIGVWVKQGLRHPGCYFAAFNAMVSAWFSWSEYIPEFSMNNHSQLWTDLIPESTTVRSDTFAESTSQVRELFGQLWNNPFLMPVLSYGLYASLLPAFCGLCALKRHKDKKIKYWLVLLPMFFSIALGCWLAPASIDAAGKRYLYPIIYTLPLTLGWCIFMAKEDRKTN